MQPLASLKALAEPIYEAFYGLREQPFAITTDPKFFYLGSSHQRAFSELLNGLRRREGILLVTGETGTGKTTLCRAVVEALGDRTFSAMVLNPYMSGAEVFRVILRDFGLVTHEELRRGTLANADVPQLVDTLEGFLRSLVPLGTHAVVVLDEAQALTPTVLDQVRLLTALEHHGRRLVQIVLCGQPGLLATLKTEPMYALSERITRRVALAPLPFDEVDAYIRHRLAVAGGTDAVRFDAEAARMVGELSRGLPRRINVLCDRALQEGRLESAEVITADFVKRAARLLAGAEVAAGPDAASEPVPMATSVEGPIALGSILLGEEAEVRPRRWRRWAAAAALVILTAAGGLGYRAYARLVLSRSTVPDAPARPAIGRDLTATSLPVPSEDEIKLMIDEMRWLSGQLPANRNQFD